MQKLLKMKRHKTKEHRQYYKDVWKHTENNCIEIKDINLRGIDFHLDHIIPIYLGYCYGINAEIIGSKENLQIIPKKENLKKNFILTEKAIEILKNKGINFEQLQRRKVDRVIPEKRKSKYQKLIKSDNPKSLTYYPKGSKKKLGL